MRAKFNKFWTSNKDYRTRVVDFMITSVFLSFNHTLRLSFYTLSTVVRTKYYCDNIESLDSISGDGPVTPIIL